jgi:flavin-binding protein dodecin
MRRGVGRVREERPAVREPAANLLDQLVGVGRGRVEALRRRDDAPVLAVGRRLVFFGDRRRVLEVARAAREQCERMLEATRLRALRVFRAKVPLAGHIGVIAGLPEQRRHRHDAVGEHGLVAGLSLLVVVRAPEHRAESGGVRVDAGEQHRASRRAGRRDEEAREQQAGARERVEVRRADLGAGHAEVGVAEIVRDDQQHVRPRLLGRGGRRREQQGEREALHRAALWPVWNDKDPACGVGLDSVCHEEEAMSVAKVTEIIASSPKSFEDAVARGVSRANKTLANVRGAWIAEQKVKCDKGKITQYRVTMRVTFVLKD